MKRNKRNRRRNPVARYMNKFNKAAVHKDRKNEYNRKKKQKEIEEQL